MDRTIRKAARRIAIDLAARRAAVGLLIGAGAGLGALLLDRLAGLSLPAALFVAIVATAVLLAVVSALLRPPGPMETAVRLDRGLGLKDRLGTAEAVRQGKVFGEFAELARADAERIAVGLDVASATPIRIGGPWPVGLALFALLAAAIAWVPPLRRAPAREATNEAAEEQRVEIASAIEQAVAGVDPDLLDETSRQDLEALEALAQQLGGGDAPPKRVGEARDESAAKMEAVADRLDEAAQRNLEALDELTRRVTSFEAPGGERSQAPSPPAELAELLDKLRRGELEQAARQAEEASAQRQELSPEERQELAEGMDSLAQHLRRPEPDQEELKEQKERVREALKDLGMDEAAAEQALESQDQRALEEALARGGADPETARELSRDLEELNQERQTRQASEAMQERLAEALQESARELEGKDAGQQGQERQETPQAQPEQEGRQEERQQPGDDQEQPQPESQGPESRQERQGPQPPDGQDQEQLQRQSQPDQQGPQEQEQQPGQGQAGQGQPGQYQEQRQAPDRKTQEPAGRQSLPQALRDLERIRREALGQKSLSRELQETARRLADNLSDEERERLAAQWMQSGGALGPQPEESSAAAGRPAGDDEFFEGREDVDLRDENAAAPERSVARWVDPQGESPGPAPPDAAQAAPAAGRDAAQRARTDAEQAVERSAVPSRYHRLIRRYFNKLTDAAPPTAPATSPPVPASGDGGTP